MKSRLANNEIELNAVGLECPLPVLEARKLSQSLKHGDIVTVICTDPLAEMDFKHFCEQSNYIFLSSDKIDDKFRIRYKFIKNS